jgi:hypothetical protein
MRYQRLFRLSLFLLVASLAVPNLAHAQPSQKNDRDALWNGMLIGAGVGAAVGMLVAPQALCGSHDTECAVIVRAVIGLPAIAGGVGIGALVDGLMSRDGAVPAGNGRTTKPRVSGVQMSLRF